MQVHLQHQCKIERFSETWLSFPLFPRETENSSPLQNISDAHPLMSLRQILLDPIESLLSLREFLLNSLIPRNLCQKLRQIRDVERVERGWEMLSLLLLSRTRMFIIPDTVIIR